MTNAASWARAVQARTQHADVVPQRVGRSGTMTNEAAIDMRTVCGVGAEIVLTGGRRIATHAPPRGTCEARMDHSVLVPSDHPRQQQSACAEQQKRTGLGYGRMGRSQRVVDKKERIWRSYVSALSTNQKEIPFSPANNVVVKKELGCVLVKESKGTSRREWKQRLHQVHG
jgi:hypothetical protein